MRSKEVDDYLQVASLIAQYVQEGIERVVENFPRGDQFDVLRTRAMGYNLTGVVDHVVQVEEVVGDTHGLGFHLSQVQQVSHQSVHHLTCVDQSL